MKKKLNPLRKNKSMNFSSKTRRMKDNYKSMFQDCSGLLSIEKDQNLSQFIDRNNEEDKVYSSTYKTKSSNFSSDSITKSIIEIPNATFNYIKEIKESVKRLFIRDDPHLSQEGALHADRGPEVRQGHHQGHLLHQLQGQGEAAAEDPSIWSELISRLVWARR